MTKLQTALKEKAVLERALEMACVFVTSECGRCPFGPHTDDYRECGDWSHSCDGHIKAHFKAKAEKGGY